jgi:hypothetical protein
MVTKLCVAQSLANPQCFSLLLIGERLHGGALDGSEIFKDTMPIMYEEYMITPFILTPMQQDQMKRILKERVSAKLSQGCKGKN